MPSDNGSNCPATCIVVGAGNRGNVYSAYAMEHPNALKVIGVADPNDEARKGFQKKFGIKESTVFSDWKAMAEKKKMADFVCICTPDRLHKEPALAFIKQGYHILLEKPMATSEEDCKAITEACKFYKVMVCVCHVLRHHLPNKKIKELIDSGTIGDVVSIQHLEPVGYNYFAHAFVRGNWRNTEESSFSLMAKSCHDIDLLCYFMPEKCKKVSSFGSLRHFKTENKPAGAGSRCLDCSVESSCPYSAKQIYLDQAKRGNFGFPVDILTDIEDVDVVREKLQSGPYGRCVYECDNDVCDNQARNVLRHILMQQFRVGKSSLVEVEVVNMEFEGGQTASFTMIAYTQAVCRRETKVFGTKGELTYHGGLDVEHFDFLTKQKQTYTCKPAMVTSAALKGHGGADFHLIHNFVRAVATNDPSAIQSGVDETLESHKIVFAAERSRLTGKTMQRDDDGEWVEV